MSDKGKTAAIEELRHEVGFGCPVCRSPFLTWHHFDPPWHVEHHWRTEGIIAMCPLCHADADSKGNKLGAYSNEELRAMKKAHHSYDGVRGHFPAWQDKENLLVRVGGVYTDSSAPVISLNEEPQITIGKNKAGLLTLSFELRDLADEILVKMEENWLTAYPRNVHDMTVTPKTKEVTVWLGEQDIGLQFSFQRVTVKDLEELMNRDRVRHEELVAVQRKEMMAQLPPDQQSWLEEISPSRSEPPFSVAGLPEELRDVYLAVDKPAHIVKQWVRKNCQMDDGAIPLLDFEQMAINFHGKRITIKDGVAGFVYYSAFFGNTKGAINLGCQCDGCAAKRQISV